MIVPEGKTLYAGKRIFKSGETIPPYLEKHAKKLFEKSNKQDQPSNKQDQTKEKKFDFKKEDK